MNNVVVKKKIFLYQNHNHENYTPQKLLVVCHIMFTITTKHNMVLISQAAFLLLFPPHTDRYRVIVKGEHLRTYCRTGNVGRN